MQGPDSDFVREWRRWMLTFALEANSDLDGDSCKERKKTREWDFSADQEMISPDGI